MEWNISDLLDDLDHVELEIRPNTGASAERIKELTMKKIHKYETPRRRSTSVLFKVALIAAVLASLAIPVMAATGFHFTDWLKGLAGESQEDYDTRYYTWEETEGFWQVSLSAKNLTPQSMTLECREVQDSPVTGSLTIHSGGVLERWNGEAFEKIGELSTGENREIKDLDCFEETVTWADVCGSLESGRYRLLKTFTYTFSNGTTAELTDWAEFRIFNEEMTPYIEQCKAALEELRSRPVSYVEYGQFSGLTSTHEIWRSGDDYLLRDNTEFNGNSILWGHMIYRGEGYEINSWNSEDIRSGAAQWEYDELIVSPDLNTFDMWYYTFSLDETQVGELWAEENEIVVVTNHTNGEGDYVYKEYTYRFDDAGNLTYAELNYLPQPWCDDSLKRLGNTLTVRDITPEAAAEVMTAQQVGQPTPFSWEEERQQNLSSGDIVKTQGFHNITPQPIETGFQAFLRAFNDYEVVAGTHHASHVSYDAQADMWRVEFWWMNGDVNAIIYLDGEGITHMTVMKPYEA